MNTYMYEVFLIDSEGNEVRFTYGKGKTGLEITVAMATYMQMNEEDGDKYSAQLTRFAITKEN